MGGFRISISDRGDLVGRLDVLSREDLNDIVGTTVLKMADEAKKAAPVGVYEGTDAKGKKRQERGGSLKNSVQTQVRGSTGVVGYTAKYAPHVEYGHRQTPGRYVPAIGKRLVASYVPGQHFFRPVVETGRKEFFRRVQKAVEEAMR